MNSIVQGKIMQQLLMTESPGLYGYKGVPPIKCKVFKCVNYIFKPVLGLSLGIQ